MALDAPTGKFQLPRVKHLPVLMFMLMLTLMLLPAHVHAHAHAHVRVRGTVKKLGNVYENDKLFL